MQFLLKNPLLYLVAKMWHYAKGNRKNVILYTSLFTVSGVITTLEPLVIGLFLNTVQAQGITQTNLVHLFLLLGLLVIQEGVFWAFHGPARIIENKNAFIVRANYRRYLLKGIMTLPVEWHTDNHSGNSNDKIEKGTAALFSFSGRTFDILYSLIFLLTSFTALLIYDRVVGMLAIVISIATFGVIVFFDSILIPGYRRVNWMENSIGAKVFDILSNITTVIILRVEKLVYHSFSGMIDKPFEQFHANNKINELKWFSSSMMGKFTVALAIGVYILIHIKQGPILIGTIYILYGFANQIRNTFFKFSYLYSDIVRYRTSVDNSEEIAKHFIKAADALDTNKLPSTWNSITVTNLSFSYHGRDHEELHLDDITLTFKKGERIAVIGDSGGGKSTFLKLMRDLYTPRSIELSIDGIQTTDGFSTISDSISLIPQDPEIFATTIRENITLGVDYTDEHIEIFTDMARFTNVVRRLPKGLESSIVEKGVNLSGGEKQRLALSRGLLASVDKDIVLLDEPTSSIDTVNEVEIYRNIFEAFPNKTVFSSIHRLHLLELFDTIYFFRNGRIITQGSFEELKNTSPEFQELWQKYMKEEISSKSVTE